jgi:glycosyltransferase involved in cell wall biosynthesis
MEVALHVGQLLQPVPGGIGRYVGALVDALPDAGVEVHGFAAGAPAPFVDLGWPRGSLRYELWHRLRRPVVRVPGDVVHATSLAVPPAGRRPLVVTVHDVVFLHQPEVLTRRGVAFHRRGLELARREARAIVVPTEFGKRELVAHGFAPDRIHVAPHGVTPTPTTGSDGDSSTNSLTNRRQNRSGTGVESSPYVLFVGTIEPRKGVADLVAAFGKLRVDRPELQLVLAGPRGWGDVPDLALPGVVELGAVDDARLSELYRSAEVLALPSRYEGFGLPVLEAMAHGCPVVVTDAACLPEVVGDAGAVVPVGDVDALAAALASPPHGEAGRMRAAQFTWARSAELHRAAYEAALS